MPEQLKIFLSYAHADNSGVGRIYQQLKDRGYKPWLDREDILGGEEWEPAIRRAIRESDLFLVCMSQNSLARRGVLQKEIKTALEVVEEKLDRDIFLIPVWIQVGSPLPKEEMPERLGRLQWINLPEADGWPKLLRAIDYQARRLERNADARLAGEIPAGASAHGGGPANAEPLVDQFRDALREASLEGVQTAVASIIQALTLRSHGFTAQHGARLLAQLWRKRLVDLVHRLGDALLLADLDASPIRRFYAEALLARGWLTATFDTLSRLEQMLASDPTERALVADLRGRSHWTAYLGTAPAAADGNADELWKAVAAYYDVYGSDPRRHVLHGVRAAALALHAARGGLPAMRDIAARDIAQRVLDEVRDAEDSGRPLGIDECEAGLHAALALDRHDEAVQRLQRCLAHPQLDVLHLCTLERQLSSIWQLQADEAPGAVLLPPVLARLATAAEPWEPAEAPHAPALRAVAGGERQPEEQRGLETALREQRYYTLPWYAKGIECARQVARIETQQGNGIATGFLLRGRELHDSLPDEPLLLTCSYVVTDDPEVKDKYAFSVLGPQEVQARFQDDPQIYSLQVIWTSLAAGATILSLAPRLEGNRGLSIARRLPVVNAADADPTRAYIVGHPGGRDLSFSLQDNVILDCDDRVVHYRTPTEPGSAGSPVFNGLWQLIAMHYKGGMHMPRLHGMGTYAANEGIRIDFIRNTIAAEVQAGTGRAQTP